MIPQHDILTFHELSVYLTVPKGSLYKYLEAGTIPAFKIGGRWKARRRDIEAWLDQQTPQVRLR